MTEVQRLILEHLHYMRIAITELSEDIREANKRLGKLIEVNAKRLEGIERHLGEYHC